MFEAQNDQFLAHYHKRSNVESAFSSVKRKFGASVRAKTPAAQVNEVLLKCLAYNLSNMFASNFMQLYVITEFQICLDNVDKLTYGNDMAKTKRPNLQLRQSVTLSSIKSPIPAYDGKPFVGRDMQLTVSHITGKGTIRDPWHVVVTDGMHFWHLEPNDVTPASA